MEIEYKGKNYKFLDSLSFIEVQHIIENYDQKPIFQTVQWWYKKTDFGVYFLNKILKDPLILPEIDKKDWYIFIPVLKNFFITITEYKNLIYNVWFLEGIGASPTEDYYFLKYIMLKNFSSLTLAELENIDYKEFMMLYKYVLGEVFVNLVKREKGRKENVKNLEKIKNMVS